MRPLSIREAPPGRGCGGPSTGSAQRVESQRAEMAFAETDFCSAVHKIHLLTTHWGLQNLFDVVRSVMFIYRFLGRNAYCLCSFENFYTYS